MSFRHLSLRTIFPLRSGQRNARSWKCRIGRTRGRDPNAVSQGNPIHGLAPVYICQLITVREMSRYSLRSNNGTLLQPPCTITKQSLGDRAFSAAAPSLWNSLPVTIRNEVNFIKFKTLLKSIFLGRLFYRLY